MSVFAVRPRAAGLFSRIFWEDATWNCARCHLELCKMPHGTVQDATWSCARGHLELCKMPHGIVQDVTWNGAGCHLELCNMPPGIMQDATWNCARCHMELCKMPHGTVQNATSWFVVCTVGCYDKLTNIKIAVKLHEANKKERCFSFLPAVKRRFIHHLWQI